jgi:hypothetical protein
MYTVKQREHTGLGAEVQTIRDGDVIEPNKNDHKQGPA